MAAVNVKKLARVLALPGNDRCSDCSALHPQWASLSFGCIFCIRCSGVHRSFGTAVSRVRSLQLDEWTTEQIKGLEVRGNDFVNGILERDIPEGMRKPTQDSKFEELSTWIKAKYVEQRFRHKPKNEEEWMQHEADDMLLNYHQSTSENHKLLQTAPMAATVVFGAIDPHQERPYNRGPTTRVKSCTIIAFHSPRSVRGSSQKDSSEEEAQKGEEGIMSTKDSSDTSRVEDLQTDGAVPSKQRQSGKLTKKEIERGWSSFQNEWKVCASDREELVRQQQLERKRMIEEAKRRKKEKARERRRSLTSALFFSRTSVSASPSASTSSSSISSTTAGDQAPQPDPSSGPSSTLSKSAPPEGGDPSTNTPGSEDGKRGKAKESRMKRLSRDLTAWFSFSAHSSNSASTGHNQTLRVRRATVADSPSGRGGSEIGPRAREPIKQDSQPTSDKHHEQSERRARRKSVGSADPLDVRSSRNGPESGSEPKGSRRSSGHYRREELDLSTAKADQREKRSQTKREKDIDTEKEHRKERRKEKGKDKEKGKEKEKRREGKVRKEGKEKEYERESSRGKEKKAKESESRRRDHRRSRSRGEYDDHPTRHDHHRAKDRHT